MNVIAVWVYFGKHDMVDLGKSEEAHWMRPPGEIDFCYLLG
jgi:hypothetical protein